MYYFIVNPASCSGRGGAIWQELKQYLDREGIEYKVFFSEHGGHVEELIKDLTVGHMDDPEAINAVILGGDGTLDEALQGIADFDKINIGYIPTGSSNDFARAFGISDTPVERLRKILSCKEPVRLDLGRLKYVDMDSEHSRIAGETVSPLRFFDVSCGIGFDAAICEEALNAGSKSFLNRIGLGKLTYLLICLKQLFGAKLTSGTLILDGEERIEFKKLRFIVGMNTRFEGGGFKFAPSAVPDDGYIDICAVNDISTLEVLLTLPKAPKGRHITNKHIHMYKVKSYEVITEDPVWVHTDGEVYTKARHIKVSCLPGKLRFLG